MITNVMERLIDFTRTSGGGYFGPDGLFRFTPASRNLLTYTQELDNGAWVKQSGSVTANAVAAPDGTTTADVFTPTAQFGNVRNPNFPTITSGTITVSVWLRVASGTRGIHIRATTNAGYYASLVPVTETWTRFSATFTHDGTTAFNEFAIQDRNASGFVPIEIWGAQLELGSTPTDYTRNVGGRYPPRFDYDPVTLAPRGLLVEEQRTNLLLRSEEFDDAVWSKSGATVTANAAVSPDGANTADKLVEDTGNSQHFVVVPFSITSGTTYTFSVYAKAAERTVINLFGSGNLGGAAVRVNLTDGSVQAGSATVTPAGGGFYRISYALTATATGSGSVYIALHNGSGTYLGDGTSGIYLWGAQLEAGAFATSYIPTAASQVTRTADNATITGANFSRWYNQSEGTFVAEFDCSGSSSALSADDATNNNFIRVGRLNTTGRLRVFSGGAEQADAHPANGAGWSGSVKVAGAFKANDFAASASGGAVATDAAGSVPAITQLRIGTSGGGDQINGHVRRIRYYPTRLSNAQLQALTA